MRIIERSLQQIGKSFLVTLPKKWVTTMKLIKGSKVKLMISDKGNLVIAPELNIKVSRKQVRITYDDKFPRRFFREYFGGNETVIINFDKKIDHEKIYGFLKRFMNVQVIDDSSRQMIIKCFKINELSIEQCLRRIHYLSLNIIDEVLSSGDKSKLDGMEITLSRFYYMLVMQVRRFLEEGKFTEENQIPLIRALDSRMVAEKIERLADTARKLKFINDHQKKYLELIKDYYKKAFNSFITGDYEKALNLWINEDDDLKSYEKKYQSHGLNHLLDYAKEISMLVR